ncbi:hypothetical protein N7497_005677 [Penicillium chrysogenum]|nr:hypothetical protein N7497_005677 [Penicillium chrysogenum]
MGETDKESVRPFFTEKLPLYHGPLVKIRLQPSGCEYTVSKGLLCEQSPVFTAMFWGRFREAQEQVVEIQEMTGVVSKHSLEALIQWLYLDSLKFDWHDPEECIESAIELARLADKYGITRIESQTAEYIKETIIANQLRGDDNDRVPSNSNTHLLAEEDIVSALMLPRWAPTQLRNIPSHLSSAFVSFDTFFRGADNAACIRIEAHLVENLKAKLLIGMDIMGHEGFRLDFDAKTLKIPSSSCPGQKKKDLLHEVRISLNTLSPIFGSVFKDPIDGKEWYLASL